MKKVGILFIDFQKAFDSVNQAIFKTGNGNEEWELGMGTGNLWGMTRESAGNQFRYKLFTLC